MIRRRHRWIAAAEGMGVPRVFAVLAALLALLAPGASSWREAGGLLASAFALAFLAYRMQAAVHRRRRMERQLARRGMRVLRNVRLQPPDAAIRELADAWQIKINPPALPPRVSEEPLVSVAAVVLATPDRTGVSA